MTTTPLDAVFEPVWVDRYLLLAEKYDPSTYAASYYARAPGAKRPRVVLVERFAPWVHTDIMFSYGYDLYREPPDLAEQFLDRARRVATVHHTNCVAVLDAGLDDEGNPYRVVEHHEGVSPLSVWKTAARRGEVLPVRLAMRLVVDACRGLHAAHEAVDAEGRPLGVTPAVLDFFSLLVGADGTTRVRHLGIPRGRQSKAQRPSYLSPEHTRKNFDDTDRRVDVFRLGTIAWELCSGRRLFTGHSDVEILEALTDARVLPVRSYSPEFPQAIDDVLRRALARDPADRYQSCADFADALEDALVESGGLAHESEVARYVQTVHAKELEAERAVLEAAMAAGPALSDAQDDDGPPIALGAPYRGGAFTGDRPTEIATSNAAPATRANSVLDKVPPPVSLRPRTAGTTRATAASCVVLLGLGVSLLTRGTTLGLVVGMLTVSLALALLGRLARRS